MTILITRKRKRFGPLSAGWLGEDFVKGSADSESLATWAWPAIPGGMLLLLELRWPRVTSQPLSWFKKKKRFE